MAKKKASKTENEFEQMMNSMFGEGTVTFMNNRDKKATSIEYVSTSIPSIDRMLGGGIPKRRYSEIYGWDGCGKTTLSLHLAAEATKKKEKVLFIDMEQSLNLEYAVHLGVDLKYFALATPESGEQVFKIIEMALKNSKEQSVGLIIVDSVAAMCPAADHETDQMGSHARLMSKGLRKLTPFLLNSCTAILWINQLRNKITSYGNPETTTGGTALRFAASLRCEVRRAGFLQTSKTDLYGQRVRLKAVKNKQAIPYKAVEVDLIYGDGYDRVQASIEEAVELSLINKSGGWYKVPGKEKPIQGKIGLKEYYLEDETRLKELIKEIENERSN